jgi:hypothetical protein
VVLRGDEAQAASSDGRMATTTERIEFLHEAAGEMTGRCLIL